MTASGKCHHPTFRFQVNVARIEDDTIWFAEISGNCDACGAAVTFRGLPLGSNPHHPTGSLDGRELCAPIVIDGEEVDELKKRPGFSVEMFQGDGM